MRCVVSKIKARIRAQIRPFVIFDLDQSTLNKALDLSVARWTRFQLAYLYEIVEIFIQLQRIRLARSLGRSGLAQ